MGLTYLKQYSHGMFSHSNNFQSDLDPLFPGHIIDVYIVIYSFQKKSFLPLCSVRRLKMTSSLNQFSIDGMRKLSRISMCIIEVTIAISFGPLNDMPPYIVNGWGNIF